MYEIKNEEERLKYQINCFNSALIPFGYLDIKEAVKVALEVGEDGDWVAEQVQEYMDSCGVELNKIDVNYCVYDSILQECRSEIETHTKKDILNDLPHCIEVYGNCMCTSFDGNEEAVKETLKLALKVPKEERSLKLKWFIEQLKDMNGGD